MTKPAGEMIDPRDAGQRVLDLKEPLFAPDAVARADEALKTMTPQLEQWLEADIVRLQAARLTAERAQWTVAAIDNLMAVAHDIRGMGATYGSPLATRLAASLCRLIETDAGKAAVQCDPSLARAHVDALRAAQRAGGRPDAAATAVLQALEASVAALGVAPR
jgi:hypothetical protein